MKNTLTTLALGLAVASAPAVAATSVIGKLQTKDAVSVKHSGMTQTVSQATVPYAAGSQISTTKSAATLQVGASTLAVAPKSSLSVTSSAPVAVDLTAGGFGTSMKAGQTLQVAGVASPLTVTAVSAGTLAVAKEGKGAALKAVSGEFVVTDASGVTRTLTSGTELATVAGAKQGQFTNTAVQFTSALPVIIGGITLGGVIYAVNEANNDDDENEASPVAE